MSNQDRQQQFGNAPGYSGGQQGGSSSQGGTRQGQQSQYQGGAQQPGSSQQAGGMQRGSGMQQGSMQRGDPMHGGAMNPGRSHDVSPYGGYGGMGGAGPFALMRRIGDEMDRIFESFGMSSGMPQLFDQGGGGGQGLRTLWSPHIELSQREGKLLIEADLPGVRKEDLDVRVEPDAVILQGHRQQESTRDEQGFYHSERSYGSFYRAIPLPEGVDTEQANATFRDGVLCIELPAPQERQRGRRLEIREGGSSSIEGSATSGSSGSNAAAGSRPESGGGKSRGTGSGAGGAGT